MSKASGPCQREGLALLEVAEKFAKEEYAHARIEELRWPDGPCCPASVALPTCKATSSTRRDAPLPGVCQQADVHDALRDGDERDAPEGSGLGHWHLSLHKHHQEQRAPYGFRIGSEAELVAAHLPIANAGQDQEERWG